MSRVTFSIRRGYSVVEGVVHLPELLEFGQHAVQRVAHLIDLVSHVFAREVLTAALGPKADIKPWSMATEIYSRWVFAISLSRSEALSSNYREERRPYCGLIHITFNHRRSSMLNVLANSNEEDLLTYELSDEALETAGGHEMVGNYTLANCTGLSECPA